MLAVHAPHVSPTGQHTAWNRLAGNRIVLSVLLAAAAFLRQGYEFARGDQGLQIAWMLWRRNPTLFENDPITLAFTDYHSLLLHFLSLAMPLVPVEALMLVLHALTLVLFFFAFLCLGERLTEHRTAAVLGAALAALLPLPAPAGSPILNSNFVPSSAAVPFIIWALILYYDERWAAMGALLGLVTLIHPLEGAVAFAALFPASALDFSRATAGRLLRSVGLYLLCALPMIVIILAGGGTSGGGQEWIETLRWRSPHHIFPLTWGPGVYARYGVFLIAGTAGLLIRLHHRSPEAGIERQVMLRRTAFLAGGVGGLFAIGLIFTELHPWPIVLKAQPIRSANLLTLALTPFAGYLFTVALAWSKSAESTTSKSTDRSSLKTRLFAAGVSAILIFILGVPFLRHSLRNLTSSLQIEAASLRDAERWGREHSLPGSRFLALPPLANFRTLSERPEFGSWNDGTLANFSPVYAHEWRRRMQLLGMTFTPEFAGYRGAAALAQLWATPDPARLKALLREISCDFIVSAAPLPSDAAWAEVYRNDSLIIYEVLVDKHVHAPANP
ncbi:MAG: hypothetical protein Kow0059_04020 [Candidatus Sumerlaeia bacterium]